ncbi:LysR substrate-binding domain-containing protein [Variovorax sp. RT4R15]|uniref:LysR substrate-binding domain-containing protein n=1 Tax=Variovorax sp. RT4R15 TaxID=3443737 RepID=UPI003F47B43D
MELRRLEIFVVVASELNVRLAAKRLGVTQPAVSLQLQILETELGFELLQRHQNRIVGLTAAGACYLPAAQQLVIQLRLARQSALDIADGHTAVVKVGLCEDVATGSQVWHALGACAKVDHLMLRFVELPPVELVEFTRARAIDLAFVPLMMNVQGLRVMHRWSESWLAVLPSAHHLANRSSLEPADLANEFLILGARDQAASGHQLIEQAFGQSGIPVRSVVRAKHRSTMMVLAATGRGIAFVPQSLGLLNLPGLTMVPFSAPNLEIGVVSPIRLEDQPPNEAVELLSGRLTSLQIPLSSQ